MKQWFCLAALSLPLLGLDNSIRIHEAGGASQSNRPFTALMLFLEGEFPSGTFPKPRINGTMPPAWQTDVKSRWPDGSVLSAFVSFPVSLSAGGNVKVDFVPDANACHLGGQAACEAAALDQSGMLNFLGGNWNAQIRGTANSISSTADAKTMIAAGAWRYWLRGPVVTRVIVEQFGFDYDFGWQWDGANWQAPSSDTYKSVHPMFELSFYPGWSGVETGFRVENPWWTKLQTLKLKLEFLAGAPAAPVYSKTNYDLEARAASSYYAWSGAEPGAVFVDRNLPYLVATRILPPYDFGVKVSASTITTYLGQWPANVGTDDFSRPDPRSCTSGMSLCAYIKTAMPDTGDHPNFGIVPRWQIAYLYAMGDTQFTVAQRRQAFEQLILGSGDAAVTIPIHYRESQTGLSPDYRNYLNWPEDQATPAFGRIKSISAHPEARCGMYDAHVTGGPYPAVYVCSNCPAKTHPWAVDRGHWPSLYSVPYILTGRFTYLMSLLQSAAYWLAWDNPQYDRHYDWGIIYNELNPREAARPLKDVFWAFLLAPESPERAYIASKLKNTDAAYEGVFHIRNGNWADQVRSDCRGTTTMGSFSQTWNSTTPNGPNGVRKKFSLPIGVVPRMGMYSITYIRVNGVDKTFGIWGQDTGKDWYWIPGGRVLIQDAAAQPLSSSDSLVVYGQIGRMATPWCQGNALISWDENPLGLPGIGDTAWIGYDTGVLGFSPWQTSYLAMHLGWMRQTGAMRVNGKRLFEYSAAGLGKLYIDGLLHPRRPVLYFGDYRLGIQDQMGLITTWDRFAAMRNPPISLAQEISAGATSFTINCVMPSAGCGNVYGNAVFKLDDEFIRTCSRSVGASTTTFTVCPGGRGYWGTTPAPHTTSSVVNAEWRILHDKLAGHTYPNLWVNALAMYYDVRAALGSGLEAYRKAESMGSGFELRASDQRYAFIPRVEPYNLKVIVAPGKAEIHYDAPTLAACRYAVSATAFATPDDANDTLDQGGPRTRRIVLAPLAPGLYYYRVTCGTGRFMGSFTVSD